LTGQERERERERMGTKDSLMRRSHTKAMNMSNCDHVKDAFMGVDKDSVCLLPKPFKLGILFVPWTQSICFVTFF
jgi:hypothetical protein